MAAKALKQKQREVLSIVARAKNGMTVAQVAKKLGWTEKVVRANLGGLCGFIETCAADDDSGTNASYVATARGAEIAANMDAAVRAASLPNR